MRKTTHEKIKLTDRRIKALLPSTTESDYVVWDTELPNFGVRVTPTGRKTYVVRLKRNGISRQRKVKECGRLPIKYIDSNGKEDGARHRARIMLLELSDGVDPQDSKRRKVAQSITLREVKAEYVKNKRTRNGKLRPSSVKDINRCLPEWDNIPVVEISRSMCLEKWYEVSQKAPVKANRDFRNLRALINRAQELTATEDGEYTIAVNPVVQLFKKNGLLKWNRVEKRKTKIPKDKIGQIYNYLTASANELNSKTKNVGADLVLFLILTGCRIGEARTLLWENVDLEAAIPTIHLSSDVVKNHHAITLPISKPLRTVLQRRFIARTDDDIYVFPATSGNTGYLADPRTLFKNISSITGVNIHPHALRRTFESIALAVGVDSDQRRLLLNHISGDVHAIHYSNADDPSTLLPELEKIGAWIEEQGAIASGSNIALISNHV